MGIKRYLILIIIMYCLSVNLFAGQVSIASNKILFTGEIAVEDYLKFKQLIDEIEDIEEVVLTSPGGNVLAGMAIGKLIKSNRLNVRVAGICASSCATYLFVAGNKKIVSRDGIILFHGSLQQEGLQEAIRLSTPEASIKTYGATFFDDGKGAPPDYILNAIGMKKVDTALEALPHLIKIEKKYFAKMKVNNQLPTYGQEGIYREFWASRKYGGFHYDLESLKKLGIKNIEIEGGEWHPEENQSFDQVYQVAYP